MNVHTQQTPDVIGLTKVAPFSRRGFMTASAAVAAGYTLAAGPGRADVITTDTTGLTVGDIKIKVADGDMAGYFARPAGVNNPPVVLVAMEIFGLHEYIKDVTPRLAKLGALAVAPDYYYRKGVDLTKITDIPQLLPIVNAKPDAELLSDLDATVAWAKAQGGDTSKLGIIGFCRGGRTVWEYSAHNAGLKAGVAFYGPPVDPPNPVWPKSPTQLAPEMKAPVLGLYGEADTGIPVAQVEALCDCVPCWKICCAAYPKRSLLRRGLDICSISQSIHTKAVPRPTTTPKNSSVRPGAVSMLPIHEPLQKNQCKRRTSERHQRNGLGAKDTKAASIIPAVPLLNFI